MNKLTNMRKNSNTGINHFYLDTCGFVISIKALAYAWKHKKKNKKHKQNGGMKKKPKLSLSN